MRIDRLASAQLAACAAAGILAAVLSGCGQENRYVAPPPPMVTVAIPVQQKVTRYLEATGYASAINTTNAVARVQGFLQKINYKDGEEVKEADGTYSLTVTFKIGVDLNTAQVLVQNRVSSALSQLPQAVLAGQYESWYAPISVILAVPLSFIGPVV